MSVVLTHNMRRESTLDEWIGGSAWTCVNCRRAGTIAEINAVPCPAPPAQSEDQVLDAIEGKGAFKP